MFETIQYDVLLWKYNYALQYLETGRHRNTILACTNATMKTFKYINSKHSKHIFFGFFKENLKPLFIMILKSTV